jgi:hypothetical protein
MTLNWMANVFTTRLFLKMFNLSLLKGKIFVNKYICGAKYIFH